MRTKKIFKALFKVGVFAAGVVATLNPATMPAGIVAACSAISSAGKDKNFSRYGLGTFSSKLQKINLDNIINGAACNIDEAENDISRNYHQ